MYVELKDGIPKFSSNVRENGIISIKTARLGWGIPQTETKLFVNGSLFGIQLVKSHLKGEKAAEMELSILQGFDRLLHFARRLRPRLPACSPSDRWLFDCPPDSLMYANAQGLKP